MVSTVPSYAEALEFLFTRTRAGKTRDPQRMRELIRLLELSLPPRSVHVVGTNGKGTVTSMLAAGLTAAGFRTGRFLSPHVERFSERIAVDGAEIPPESVQAFVARIQPLDLEAAFFELTLALALEHFTTQGVEVAAIEAGVGALNDATIVLENVAAFVLTNVDKDHLETLGSTLTDIARDKAAGIRPGVPTVTGVQGEALELIREVAAAQGSPLFVDTPEDSLFGLPEVLGNLARTKPIRARNARLAAATLRLLELPESAVLAGLQAPPLAARRETFSIDGKTVILDGAHNPAAARALRETLLEPYVLLFAALAKKRGEETLAELEPPALITFITQAHGEASGLLNPSRQYVAEPQRALEAALAACPPGGQVVIAGSFYLAGDLRAWLREASSGRDG